MSRGPDSATLLRRALERSADAAGHAVSVEVDEVTRWASATFAGARHGVTLAGPDTADVERWIAALPEHDLPLRRHLVADLAVLAVTRSGGTVTATIEVLTVEQ